MVRRHYANIAATIAVVIAVTGVAPVDAAKNFITGRDIKNGTIGTKDIAKGGVRGPDIKAGTVGTSDIANSSLTTADYAAGSVTPQDVTMPEPVQFEVPAGQETIAKVSDQYALVAKVGTYTKVDGTSALEVTWTGTAGAQFSPCHFQLRIGGNPSAGGGAVFVGGGAAPVSATALFAGLPVGEHTVEVWARHVPPANDTGDCTLGPVQTAVAQTFVVAEKVL